MIDMMEHGLKEKKMAKVQISLLMVINMWVNTWKENLMEMVLINGRQEANMRGNSMMG